MGSPPDMIIFAIKSKVSVTSVTILNYLNGPHLSLVPTPSPKVVIWGYPLNVDMFGIKPKDLMRTITIDDLNKSHLPLGLTKSPKVAIRD